VLALGKFLLVVVTVMGFVVGYAAGSLVH
jgi:hypothetical protein